MTTGFDVVIPSAGRPALELCLLALATGSGPLPDAVVVVDDRPQGEDDRPLVRGQIEAELDGRLRIVRPAPPGRGPAAARNAGWRACSAEWVSFLDDDVVPEPAWRQRLAEDVRAAGPEVAGSEGRIRVPLPRDRRPTDWERQVAGLAQARWATADMAYRRIALEATGGFDERFPRAYREDADLALRIEAKGWLLTAGTRGVAHPVQDASPWISVRRQRGNADDPFMALLHGAGWRVRAQAPPGRLRRHIGLTAAAGGAVALAAARRRRAAVACGAAWLAGTAEFAWARVAPGPRSGGEIGAMVATSAVIPPVAVFWNVFGRATRRARAAAGGPVPADGAARGPVELGWSPSVVPGDPPLVQAVLFDRDGTLVVDVPYNGDPNRVQPLPGAVDAIARVRGAGLATALVSNQSGVARGLLTREQVDRVNARVDAALGPFGAIVYCPHGPQDACDCRKPAPGLVFEAAARLGVDPAACVLIGDIGADVEAARAAGARGILVPTPRTRRAEVTAAPEVAASIREAVDLVLGAVAEEVAA